MEGFDQVYLGEDGGIFQLVREVADVWQRVVISLGLVVQETEVPARTIASR